MNHHELTPFEAKAIVRHHVHDLRNLLNCLDLEVCCLMEDPAGSAAGPPLGKIRDHLARMERTARSLSVRFMDPSTSIAAAVDVFYNWRQQLQQQGQGPEILWEEPACAAAITVDFTAVVTVLSELCLQMKFLASPQPLGAAICEEEGSVIFSIREPVPEGNLDSPPDNQQWLEWERLVINSGGQLTRKYEESPALWVTRLAFPVVM